MRQKDKEHYLLGVNEQVFGLDIPVNNILSMAVLDRFE